MLSGYVLGQVLYCCAPGCKPEVGDMLNPFAPKICMTGRHGVGQELVRSSPEGIPSGWGQEIELSRIAERSGAGVQAEPSGKALGWTAGGSRKAVARP